MILNFKRVALLICFISIWAVSAVRGDVKLASKTTGQSDKYEEQIGQLSSQDKSIQNIAQAFLLKQGPNALESLQRIRSAADLILEKYAMLMSKDRVKGRQAARFFGDNKATLFLVEGLKTEDLDIKGACIEELRRCKPDDLEAIIPQLLMTLESAKDSFSYSTREEFSISEICKSELTYLIADIIKQEKIKREDMNGDREEKTIQNVIARAKQWLTQREATLKSTDKK